ncbi:MAG: hypothetical protein SGILL_006799 [Bacillariaceae sp.]
MPPSTEVMDFSRNSQGYGTNNNDSGNGEANNNDASNQGQGDDSSAANANNNQDLMRRLQASRGNAAGGFSMDGLGGGALGMFGAQGMGAGTGSGEQEELLSHIMYARRLRALGGQLPEGAGGAGTSDELLRLRQAGNATAATAAMFSGSENAAELSQLQQQQQQFQQFQNMGYGFGAAASMFPQSMGMNMNLPPGASQAFMMQAAAEQMPGAFAGRGFDDYLLRTQQQNAQEAIRGANADQQRIELSPSRFLAMQQQPAGMGMMDAMSKKDGDKLDEKGGKSKKRYHKKKPSDMPRRPLSAYNLFFSEERERILKEIDAKEKGEDPPKDEEEVEDSKKPKALLRPLLPSEKKRRPHRKTHGKISFRELAQMVGQRWKALDDEKRAYYQGLAKEDMARQKKAMEEYYLKQSEKAKSADGGKGAGVDLSVKGEV